MPRATVWLVSALVAVALGEAGSREPPRPRLILWAWERPERLGFLDASTTGVAFLAATIGLGHDRCEFRPRLQPPIVPAGARRMAVGRIETQPPADLLPPVKDVVDLLLRVTTVSGLDALQIDSDTLRSERTYYREILKDLRRRLPSRLRLSITALASWTSDEAALLEGDPAARPMARDPGGPFQDDLTLVALQVTPRGAPERAPGLAAWPA